MSAVGRPFIVTLLGVIVIIFGILGIIAGIGGLFSGTGWLIALVTIILGLIYVLVARGLFRGSGGARFIIAIVTVLHLLTGIWEMITFWSSSAWGARFFEGLIQGIVALLILLLLYTPKATAFFKSN
jgi:uncharacterized membrane protein HdeD (DUF308 family)